MNAQQYGGGGGGGGQSPSSSASSASAINFGGNAPGEPFSPIGLVIIGSLALLAFLGFVLVLKRN
jgi:hypothetical protein